MSLMEDHADEFFQYVERHDRYLSVCGCMGGVVTGPPSVCGLATPSSANGYCQPRCNHVFVGDY
ncbi:hypothetical protein CY34DRAFT_811015 [Suillus luteus UH-Slu-Lm8-n1]|uniref:Uncharacterized protein n=1 Tax=Suillus luteus UH-Slu-Lm8-n1 TaxID=930992 RepID=A0A0D0AR39_9AGAM|nr:hypothetical protein CY34DRAFT_811015 [Suillus luteus UH-Slu-Lm8-n1]